MSRHSRRCIERLARKYGRKTVSLWPFFASSQDERDQHGQGDHGRQNGRLLRLSRSFVRPVGLSARGPGQGQQDRGRREDSKDRRLRRLTGQQPARPSWYHSRNAGAFGSRSVISPVELILGLGVPGWVAALALAKVSNGSVASMVRRPRGGRLPLLSAGGDQRQHRQCQQRATPSATVSALPLSQPSPARPIAGVCAAASPVRSESRHNAVA